MKNVFYNSWVAKTVLCLSKCHTIMLFGFVFYKLKEEEVVQRAKNRKLRELGVSLSIPCEKLLQMLAVLEVYAIDCYNKTTDHEFAIKSLATRAEIEAYDFRVGYPDIPRFEL